MILLSIDLKGVSSEYKDFFEKIQMIGGGGDGVLRILDSTWVLNTTLTADEISDALKGLVQQGDRFIAVDMTSRDNRQGWLTKAMWDWMSSKSTVEKFNYHLAYDKVEGEDNNAILVSILRALKEQLRVVQERVNRPSETTLLFYSTENKNNVFKVLKGVLSKRAYFSLSRIDPAQNISGLLVQGNESLTDSLAEKWNAL